MPKYFHTALELADLAALRALSGASDPKLVDGGKYWVKDTDGGGTPGHYRYYAELSSAESAPSIVVPTAPTTGIFRLIGGSNGAAATSGLTAPATPPSFVGQIYVQLTTDSLGHQSGYRFWVGADPTGMGGNTVGWNYLTLN